MPPYAVRRKCAATHLHVWIYGHLHSLWSCLRVRTLHLNDSCPFLLLLKRPRSRVAACPPEEHRLQHRHALSEVTPCISRRVHRRSFTRWCDARVERKCETESQHSNSGPCGAWQGLYAPALSHKHHSAVGPGAECLLTPVCSPHFSVVCHSLSLMLTPGLSVTACRCVSIIPISLSVSVPLSLTLCLCPSLSLSLSLEGVFPHLNIKGMKHKVTN